MKNLKIGLGFAGLAFAFASDAAWAGTKEKFAKETEPLLAKYCYDCHGDGASKGDIRLDEFSDFQSLSKDGRVWKRVWENLYRQNMPPARKPQPTEAEREIVLSWIERAVFLFDPSKPDPGRVTIRRLNRVEYDNVVRDLTGVDFNPAKDFPPDDTGHGFDTIGGFVLHQLGKIPSAGDSVEYNGLSIEVVSTTGRRIKSLRIKKLDTPKTDDA